MWRMIIPLMLNGRQGIFSSFKGHTYRSLAVDGKDTDVVRRRDKNTPWNHLLLCIPSFYIIANRAECWRKLGSCEPVCGVWCLWLCVCVWVIVSATAIGLVGQKNSKPLLWQLIICELRLVWRRWSVGLCVYVQVCCGAVHLLLKIIVIIW